MKSIFGSKTFWVNALVFTTSLAGILPQKYAAVVLPIVNVALRLVTKQGVTLLGKTGTKE